MAIPAAREPEPLVIRLRWRTVAKVDSGLVVRRQMLARDRTGSRQGNSRGACAVREQIQRIRDAIARTAQHASAREELRELIEKRAADRAISVELPGTRQF